MCMRRSTINIARSSVSIMSHRPASTSISRAQFPPARTDDTHVYAIDVLASPPRCLLYPRMRINTSDLQIDPFSGKTGMANGTMAHSKPCSRTSCLWGMASLSYQRTSPFPVSVQSHTRQRNMLSEDFRFSHY